LKRVMLINVFIPEESRVAVVENGVLEELYLERSDTESYVGNIYKGKVNNVEPSLQAAFVDVGLPRNGFLHVSDVASSLYPAKSSKTPRRRGSRPPIQHILKRGQEVVVQVTKHGLGNKGAALTTYLSIPGKYLVIMPDIKKVGVSRKIVDGEDREQLKKAVESLTVPKDVGIIARTAASGRTKRELSRDMSFLKRLWTTIQKRAKKVSAPALVYQESDFIIRTMRDIFSSEIDEVHIDSEPVLRKAREFVKICMPRSVSRLKFHKAAEPLFHHYKVEEQVEDVYNRRVDLPCGAYLVIEQTEAMVSIDVNSGSYHGKADSEQAVLDINLEAAREIARQIRLRDLGGVIVCDFIDMRHQSSRQKVERALTEATARDRARKRMLRLSRFGLMEMTRQRIRSSVERSVLVKCPCCDGRGLARSPESMAVCVLRELSMRAGKVSGAVVSVRVHPTVEQYLQNTKRSQIAALEANFTVKINILGERDFGLEEFKIEV